MRCVICSEKIENAVPLRIFGKNICRLCLYSITDIKINHIFYDFYKDRIKYLVTGQLKDTI